jgi:hypothetical protein
VSLFACRTEITDFSFSLTLQQELCPAMLAEQQEAFGL